MVAAHNQRIAVIGRGLAGALVAWKFFERGCAVEWWGNGSHSASSVAAGMFNPVSFRRVLEVWNAPIHLAEMRSTMTALERALNLNGKLLFDVPVAKLFANDDYRLTWDARWDERHPVCQWAHRGEECAGLNLSSLQGPAGLGRVHASGWVDVPALLAALEKYFEAEGSLKDGHWNVSQGVPKGCDAVVDCRGVGASEELAEVGITVNPNHGDVLTLSTPLEGQGVLNTCGYTINNGKWLLPMFQKNGRQHWRLGATFSWHRFKPQPDEASVFALKSHMSMAFGEEGSGAVMGAQLEKHQAGLRPASPDRRPTVGPWPGQPRNVLMVNGFGTRGVLVGPSMAKHLVAWWLDNEPLPEAVRASRFKSVRTKVFGFQD